MTCGKRVDVVSSCDEEKWCEGEGLKESWKLRKGREVSSMP